MPFEHYVTPNPILVKGAKMSKRKQPRSYYTDIPWVDVTPEQARTLSGGKLGPIIWLIAIYFLGIGALKFVLFLQADQGLGAAVLNSIWPLLAGIGLVLRVPWSIVMAVIASGVTVFFLVTRLGLGDVATLLETIINVGVLFYLVDGDRPNLIYRHRFRKYSLEDADGEPSETDPSA